MTPDGDRRETGRHVVVRQSPRKNPSKEQDGEVFQESENDIVDGDDDVEGEPGNDRASLLNEINDIQKQLSAITAFVPKHRQDKIVTGPASSGSSACGEVPDFDDNPNLSLLSAVVRDASRHSAHCPHTRHLSANWIQQINDNR